MKAAALAAFYGDALVDGHALWARDAAEEIRRRVQDGPSMLAWILIESGFYYRTTFLDVKNLPSLCGEIEQCIAGKRSCELVSHKDLVELFLHCLRRRTNDLTSVRLEQLDKVMHGDELFVLSEIERRLKEMFYDDVLSSLWATYVEGVVDDNFLVQVLAERMSGEYDTNFVVTLEGLDMTPLLGKYP